ncbi:acyltransferase [Paraglaciecola sp. 20A4]|uniref:acyltransferase family protein n=1 Tax=Paraglaciecola sp. 20A4 TaxID=2687288 RepID=UPI00140E51A7|nr:acyltransferase [Paraglaciecola sp. 20A4]
MKRCDFVDWMKAVGMFLIVFGHFFGDPFDQFTQPVYPKQLGVAMFVFIMGWGLGKATGPRYKVSYNRLFPMFFWGIIIALFISVISFFAINDISESNYAPFVFGVNVIFNFFPANPTTWFIGTYFHIILLWALILYRIKVTPLILVLSLIIEVLTRSYFIHDHSTFIAYMSLPNWLTIFVLGMYMCQQKDQDSSKGLLLGIIAWATFIIFWAVILNEINVTRRFPFKNIQVSTDLMNALYTSVAVSIVYLCNTMFSILVFSRIKAGRIVRFFSRNTIIVFIGHMPLYYVIEPIVNLVFSTGWPKRLCIVLIMYIGLSWVSELLCKAIKVDEIKKWGWGKLVHWMPMLAK